MRNVPEPHRHRELLTQYRTVRQHPVRKYPATNLQSPYQYLAFEHCVTSETSCSAVNRHRRTQTIPGIPSAICDSSWWNPQVSSDPCWRQTCQIVDQPVEERRTARRRFVPLRRKERKEQGS